jgi:hypothetical protein
MVQYDVGLSTTKLWLIDALDDERGECESTNEDVDASGEIVGSLDAVDGVVEVIEREVRETLETLGERQRVGYVAAKSLHREWRSDEDHGGLVADSTRCVVNGTHARKGGF